MAGCVQFCFLLSIVTCSWAFMFSRDYKWNSLKVTWGVNPFSRYTFADMPQREQDAKAMGFRKIADCQDSSSLLGRRYVKNNDTALILIYDVQGYIAGISAAVPHRNDYPSSFLKNHPFVKQADQHIISAYFIDPAKICTTGRTIEEFSAQGVGTDLYIQNGTDPVRDAIRIPRHQADISDTLWTRGKCFYTMGVHYWFNVRRDMSCDEFYPVFLLYNDGQLDAFGWAFGTQLSSWRIEHPPKRALTSFINPVPDCLYSAPHLSTMHIYLSDNPSYC